MHAKNPPNPDAIDVAGKTVKVGVTFNDAVRVQ
jgi:hypothetical protein